jgi:hypothetical protein
MAPAQAADPHPDLGPDVAISRHGFVSLMSIGTRTSSFDPLIQLGLAVHARRVETSNTERQEGKITCRTSMPS